LSNVDDDIFWLITFNSADYSAFRLDAGIMHRVVCLFTELFADTHSTYLLMDSQLELTWVIGGLIIYRYNMPSTIPQRSPILIL